MLATKTHVALPHLEQVATHCGPDRDPRGWSVSTLFFSLLPSDQGPAVAGSKTEAIEWADPEKPGHRLGFDHGQMLAKALEALRDKVERGALPLHLLPARFTLTEPQRACESILGRTFDNTAIADWCARRLAADAEVFTDGPWAFRRFADAGHAHTVLEAGSGRAACEVRGARWVNVVLANVKRAFSGSYHAIRQGKYARRYLAEAAYRFNRRFRLRELLPRLARAMMLCAPCAEPSLRLATNFHG